MKATETEIVVLMTLALVAWFAWAWMQTRGGHDEQASQKAEVDHALAEAQEAARGHAPAPVYRVRPRGDERHEVGRWARQGGDASGVHPDVREHWARTPIMQLEGGRTHGRSSDERATSTGDRPTRLVTR